MTTTPKPSLTRMRELQQHIGLLASVDPSDAPFLSCYLDLSQGMQGCRRFLDQRARGLRQGLGGAERADVDDALALIEAGLAEDLHPQVRGIALFARGQGGGEFRLSLPLAVPVENRLTLYPAPDIYPLVEFRDTYDRYLLVLVRPGWVQVAEVNLGAVSIRGWAASPGTSRGDIGGAWQRPGGPRPDSGHVRPDSQVRLVERLVRAGGHDHLILAGDPERAEGMRSLLTPSLKARVVDLLPVPAGHSLQDAVAASLSAFLEFEERESRAVATRVLRGVRSRGLAVTGGLASLQALREGTADMLVMATGLASGPVGLQGGRSEIGIPVQSPDNRGCMSPGGAHAGGLWAELVRLAGQQGVPVEVVDSDELRYLGGVGCLLRYRADSGAQPRPQRYGRLALVA